MYSTFHKNDSRFSTKKAEKSISSVRCLYLTNKKNEVGRFPAFYIVFLRVGGYSFVRKAGF
jgi:hypothetical protein